MNAILDILLDGLWAGLAAMGFAAVSNPPRNSFLYVALISAIGHMLRFILIHNTNLDIAITSFFASLVIGTLGIFVGIRLRLPSEVFSFPALLPMVPGFYGYHALLGIMRFIQATDKAAKMDLLPAILSNSIDAALIMLALGIGVSIPILIFQKKVDIAAYKRKVNLSK